MVYLKYTAIGSNIMKYNRCIYLSLKTKGITRKDVKNIKNINQLFVGFIVIALELPFENSNIAKKYSTNPNKFPYNKNQIVKKEKNTIKIDNNTTVIFLYLKKMKLKYAKRIKILGIPIEAVIVRDKATNKLDRMIKIFLCVNSYSNISSKHIKNKRLSIFIVNTIIEVSINNAA
jgi:hypothetical protein